VGTRMTHLIETEQLFFDQTSGKSIYTCDGKNGKEIPSMDHYNNTIVVVYSSLQKRLKISGEYQ